ncbi:hypothetical protein GFV16_17670 [Bacillus megaterium]|uniref:hypothetical protein n=1 Tax=Priestia megaterium TaxID=1404 RepID=UPI0012931EF5|nr:hypothetical protein [Priestia megaterium]MQR87729.1 hypothetical protein [Priestia megaterium]
MNKCGVLSFVLVIISFSFFMVRRGPDVNMYVDIAVLGILSLVGIVFASVSKKWYSIIGGVVLNFWMLSLAVFLFVVGIIEK